MCQIARLSLLHRLKVNISGDARCYEAPCFYKALAFIVNQLLIGYLISGNMFKYLVIKRLTFELVIVFLHVLASGSKKEVVV